MSRSFMVLWQTDDEANGYTDILPVQWFVNEGTSFDKAHIVVGSENVRPFRRLARFDLTVAGRIAYLDYKKYEQTNAENDIEIGVMKLQFSNDSRAEIEGMLWHCQIDGNFTKQACSIIIREPPASDLVEPPKRLKTVINRVIRDSEMAQRVKQIYGWKCQICSHTINLADGTLYIEAHHIQPLGGEHKGPDVQENIICVCPNHHVELDYGTRKIHLKELLISEEHTINEKYIKYHNSVIVPKIRPT